jgi:hypothetical protein
MTEPIDYDFSLSDADDGSYCAMCGTKSVPLLDFLLPPQQSAIQFCGACLSRIAAEATTLGLVEWLRVGYCIRRDGA